VLVPLTDSNNPYSKMMLDLIVDQTPFPSSPLPRRTTQMVEQRMTPGQIAAVVAIVVALGGAIVAGLIRTLQP
jgi:hypothetical protein